MKRTRPADHIRGRRERSVFRKRLSSPLIDVRNDFYAKLRGGLADPDLLRRAMANRAWLFTPQEHYQALRSRYYAGPPAEQRRSA